MMGDAVIPEGTRPLSGQLWRYGITGLINTVLGLAVIFALHLGLGAGLVISNAAGYGVGLLVSFVLNRSWTFASHQTITSTVPKYLALIAIAFALCLGLITILQAAGISYLIAQILGTTLYSVIVFLGAKYVVFNR